MRRESRRKRLAVPSVQHRETSIPDPPRGTTEPVSLVEAAAAPSDPRRVTITLTESGEFDFESMRSKTRDRVRAAVAAVAPAPAAAPAPLSSSLFDESLCVVLYEAIGSIAVALARKNGYPIEQAQTLAFTDEEKRGLAPLTSKVLDKWLPNSGKYAEEATLALALFGIVSAKVALLKKPAPVIPHLVPQASDAPAS
jgi:hypothetical protein